MGLAHVTAATCACATALLGFENRRVEKTYEDTEHKWVYYPPNSRFILSTRKVIRTTSYREDIPIYKWICLPTLRPIG